MAIFRVHIDADGSKSGWLTAESSAPGESFLLAVSRAYNISVRAAPGDPEARDFKMGLLRFDDEFVSVGFADAFGPVHDYFGERAERDDSGISLAVDGIGGDSIEIFTDLYAIASALLFAKDIGSYALKGWGSAVHKRARDLAKGWIRTGSISSELRVAVFSQREWHESAFSSTFGLSMSEGIKLLRECGYVNQGGDLWVDPTD